MASYDIADSQMTIEDAVIEVDRLMHIGQVGHLHQGIAIIDPRPEVIVAAIVLGLEASTSKENWRTYSIGIGIGSGYGYGNGNGDGYGYGDGEGYGYGYGNAYGSGFGDGYGYGSGDGYGGGDGYGDGHGSGDGYGYENNT